MPIDYKLYHPKWTLIRRMILKRANHKCENCGVDNYAQGHRNKVGDFIECSPFRSDFAGKKHIKIVLTIAHLDQDIRNNRFSNLKAFCQRCHLKHDGKMHAYSRKYGKNRREQLGIFNNQSK